MRISEAVVRLMAPVPPFTAEEVWQSLLGRKDGEPSSRRSTRRIPPLPLGEGRDLVARFDRLFGYGRRSKALEIVRTLGTIGNGLEAECPPGPHPISRLLGRHAALLPTVHRLPGRSAGARSRPGQRAFPRDRIGVRPRRVEECERCWNVTEDVGWSPAPGRLRRCARAITVIWRRAEPRCDDDHPCVVTPDAHDLAVVAGDQASKRMIRIDAVARLIPVVPGLQPDACGEPGAPLFGAARPARSLALRPVHSVPLAAIVLIVYFSAGTLGRYAGHVGLSLILGGALGNRRSHCLGYVTDFLDVFVSDHHLARVQRRRLAHLRQRVLPGSQPAPDAPETAPTGIPSEEARDASRPV
jgi:hypothetical protein